jgi:hypothetical protein
VGSARLDGGRRANQGENVGQGVDDRPAAGGLGGHQLHRSQQSFAGRAADPAAVFADAGAAWGVAVGFLLDVRADADLWDCGLALGPFSGGLGDGWRLPVVVGRHDGHGTGREFLDTLCGAAAAGRGRVGGVPLLLAGVCRASAGASRTSELVDRCGDEAGAGDRARLLEACCWCTWDGGCSSWCWERGDCCGCFRGSS